MNKTINHPRTAAFLLALTLLSASVAFAEVLQEITVKEGDTLWSVANYYLKDPQRWPEILKYNNLPSSDLNVILPGMKLRVPMLLIKEHLRAAHLIFIDNDVRYRRKAEAEWQRTVLDMELYNEDGLRTMQQSSAKVKFPSGEVLNMDENSLIILKPEKKQEEIDLLSGGVRASKTKILTSSTMIDPKIEAKGATAPDFKTRIKEDKTTLVEVYEGIVDVTAQGKTVTLTKGFGTEVKFHQPPSLPRTLPPSPGIQTALKNTGASQLKPEPQTVVNNSLKFNINPPDASSQQGSKENGEHQSKVLGQLVNNYRVQVSTSYDFLNILINETRSIKDKTVLDFKKYQLSDGVYYYRYAFVDDLGFEGQHSIPVRFIIDTIPPALDIATPHDGEEFDTEFISVEGATKPGATVKINGNTLVADEKGKFISAIMPKKGNNLITISAVDGAGNTTKKEITVQKVNAPGNASERPSSTDKDKGSSILSLSLGTLTIVVIVGVVLLFIK